MQIKKLIVTTLLALLMGTSALAQNEAQSLYNNLPVFMQAVQVKAQVNQQNYAMAQQVGNGQEMQYCQAEAQLHQMMYNGVSNLMQNPQQLNDPAVRRQFLSMFYEWNYRTDCRDLRPFDQIQGPLAQYVQQATWKATTPEGQAAHQATINGINATTAQNTANHNARMAEMSAQANARNQAWNQQQVNQDASHQRYVHGIYNEYQYNNPNTGQGYWVPMEVQNPAVQNPDGTYTPLTPYSTP